MKILVLGGAGMLGHKVAQRLSKRTSDVWWTLRGGASEPALVPVPLLRGDHAIQNVDAMRSDVVEGAIRDVRPDVVVNCVGLIKQRAEGSAPLPAVSINALLPHLVAATLKPWGGRLVHISTDCVFSGLRGDYTEDDEPDATDLYGRSKTLGEVRVGNAITLRTSLIGRELKHHQALLDWFLAQRTRRIRGYRRAIWSGVTAGHLAEVIEMLIYEHSSLAGVYHVSSGRVSKFALLCELQRCYALDVEIEPDDSLHCDRSLVGTRFQAATGYRCPPLATLLGDLVADPTPYPSLV